ncbi:MAG TPA: permease [Croceibacterium sp.]|jgi:peptidoglycan/LPS O-acetylase OafA/YrhL
MSSDLANSIGFVGMALIVSAYAYVTASKAANPYLLHGMNLIGAGLLILSLTVNRNIPSMVLESVWAAVALFGLAKAFVTPRGTR